MSAQREPTPEWLAKFAQEYPEPEESGSRIRRRSVQEASVRRHRSEKSEKGRAAKLPDWMSDRSLLPKKPPSAPKRTEGE